MANGGAVFGDIVVGSQTLWVGMRYSGIWRGGLIALPSGLRWEALGGGLDEQMLWDRELLLSCIYVLMSVVMEMLFRIV